MKTLVFHRTYLKMFGQLLRPAMHSFNIQTSKGILQRKFSASAPFHHSFLLEQLERRYLIKLSGPDTTKFLQGMVTNDIRHLEPDPETSVTLPSIYAMLLNMQGRVIYDTLVYKLKQKKDEYIMEYDSSALQYMQTHLKMYRVRKEVVVETVHENMSVWSVYPNPNETTWESVKDFPASYIDELNSKDSVVTAVRDPRLPQLGYRVILHRGADLKALLPDFSLSSSSDNQYMLLRYKLGIGEGVKDLPPGNCFALESNVDYLHGVSFHKGCYIGQELTARTYHTGVIRKRLMPVILNTESNHLPEIPIDCAVLNEQGLKMGRFRSHLKQYGLAVLKVEDALKAKTLSLKGFDITMKTFRPKWWPQEMGNERNIRQ